MTAAPSSGLLRVLLVEDNPGDARLIREVLRDPARYEVIRVRTAADAMAAIRSRPFDVALVDLGLPDSEGLSTLHGVINAAPALPVVVLTGLDDAALSLEAIRLGAQDYLTKGAAPPEFVERSIRYATERKRSSERLEHLNRVLAAIRSVVKRIAVETDPQSLATSVCRTLVETRGYDAAMIALFDESGVPAFVAEHGWAGPRFDVLASAWRSGSPLPCGGCGELVARRVTLPSSCAHPDCPIRGNHGAAIARLQHLDGRFGILAVSFPGGLEPTDEDLVLIEEIADDVALGLHNLRVEAARDAAEARYRALVENASVGIVVATEDAVIVEANREANAIFGGTLVGQNAFELVDPEHRPLFLAKLAEIRELGRVHLPDLLAIRADGAVRSVELSASFVPVGGRQFLFAVYRDITEEKKLRSQVMASDRMASVGILAAGVAHEINNPLAVVAANIDYIARELRELAPAPSEDVLEALADGKSAAERVREIVKDMKLFSRAEDDSCGPVDVERVLDSTVRMAGNEIRHRAKLVKAYSKVPLVNANESRLGQVFLNLIVNAAQAIPEGSANRNEITLATSVDANGFVVIEVRDTGPGIPPETLRKLFTPFFTTKPRGVGTGLGLAICLRIVNGLGGQISVESTVGKGTTFRIVLSPSETARVGAKEEPEVVPASRRGRVLVLDDEPMVGSAVRRILGAEHDVESFTDGREALERIRSGTAFDVILCDLMMPVMTGMQFDEQLSKLSPESASRLVFVTGGAFTSDARAFLDQTTRPCMQKPFEAPALRSWVNARCNAT